MRHETCATWPTHAVAQQKMNMIFGFYIEWHEVTQYHYHCLPDGALNSYDGNFVDQTFQQKKNKQPEN